MAAFEVHWTKIKSKINFFIDLKTVKSDLNFKIVSGGMLSGIPRLSVYFTYYPPIHNHIIQIQTMQL